MAWIVPETDVSVPVWVELATFAFVLFRFFDIVKLGVIDRIQSLPNGWGVLMDDFLAGIVAGGFILLATQI